MAVIFGVGVAGAPGAGARYAIDEAVYLGRTSALALARASVAANVLVGVLAVLVGAKLGPSL